MVNTKHAGFHGNFKVEFNFSSQCPQNGLQTQKTSTAQKSGGGFGSYSNGPISFSGAAAHLSNGLAKFKSGKRLAGGGGQFPMQHR